MNQTDLRYPIGRYQKPEQITPKLIQSWIVEIQNFPEKLKEQIVGLNKEELNWRYRPDGWTIKQVIHHCADSHINSIVRFKLTLTEDEPTIKPYFEDRWAELPDVTETPIEWSMMILEGLHKRWAYLLKSLDEKDWNRVFIHPEHGRKISIGENIALYAWHCKHHLEHIKQAKKFKGEFNEESPAE